MNDVFDVPVGVERTLIRILSKCKGSHKAIGRERLLRLVNETPGVVVSDRMMRKAIENLREQGYLICNLMEGRGYYMAASLEEYQDFRDKYGSYAFTMLEKIRAMDKAAERQFGRFSPAKQGKMF